MAKKLDFTNKTPVTFGKTTTPKEIEIKEGSIVKIPIEKIDLGDNIRNSFTDQDDDLFELGSTIKEYGQLEPCVVYQKGDRFVLKIGSRRYKACLNSNISTLDCIISNNFKDETERIILQAVENEHRSNMTNRERENYMSKLKEKGMTVDDIAKVLHKTKGWVSQCLQAHDFIEKNEDILSSISEEPTTRTIWEASKLSKKNLDEALKETKEQGGGKELFSKNINKKYKQEKNKMDSSEESIENDNTSEEFSPGAFDVDFSVDEGNNFKENKINDYEDVKSIDLHYSITINDTNHSVKISSLVSMDKELNDFINDKLSDYYLSKDFKID